MTTSSWKDYVLPALELVKELGLNPKHTIFEEVSQQDLNRVAAQGVPWTLPHWSRGREYLQLDAQWKYGYSIIYEVVFDMGDHAVAYISQNQIQSIVTLTVPHVYGHSHVYQENVHQSHSGDLWSKYREAYRRYLEYEKDLGYETLEPWIELSQALAPLVSRLTPSYPDDVSPGYYDPYQVDDTPQYYKNPEERKVIAKKLSVAKSRGYGDSDILRWIITHLPLESWQQDILYIERELALYWEDRTRTKIVHEGFATWTHKSILPKLKLPAEWYLELARAHASVTTSRITNPYWLGWQTMEYIYTQYGLEKLLEVTKNSSDQALLYAYSKDPDWYAFIYEALSGGKIYEVSSDEPSYIYDYHQFYDDFSYSLREEIIPSLYRTKLKIEIGKHPQVEETPNRFKLMESKAEHSIGYITLTALDPLDLTYAKRVLELMSKVLQVDVMLYHINS